MKASSTKSSQQYKTRECSLYGFLIQHKDAQTSVDAETPYSKLVQFCTFLVNNGHQKGHQVKFRDTVTMYQQPVLNQNDTPKFGLLITHQKIAFPVSEALPIQDGLSDITTAITEDFERAQADLTGCSGVYSQSDCLKLFPDDQIQKYENVTIKICHQLRASSGRNKGQLLTNLIKENEKDSNNQHGEQQQQYPTFQKPQPDPGLQIFAEGSGFKSQSSKQLIGDEFKFIFNDYPEICSKYAGFAPTATGSSTIRTVKMRIYKMFQEHEVVQPQMNMMLNPGYDWRYDNHQEPAPEPQLIWKEVNLIEELFDEGSSDPVENQKNNNYQQHLDDHQYHKDNNNNNNNNSQAQAQQQSLTDPPSNYGNQQQDPSEQQNYNQGGYPNQGGKINMQYQQQQPGYATQDNNYSQPPYPSDSSIFEHERNNQHFNNNNQNNQNDNMGGLQQNFGANNGQFIEEEKAPEQQVQEQSELSKLELYHVELSGMCSDQDQQIYSQMLAEFSTKFSSFVELAPVTFKNFSFKEE